LTGWLLPTEGGRFQYTPAQFVTLYERGNSLWCFDEMDAFDANMLMVGNVATSNGHMNIPHRHENPIVTRGPNVGFIATTNTFGTGADAMYVSRNQLDAATLDRWIVIEMDYDRVFEETYGLAHGLTTTEIRDIWQLREKADFAKLRRVISTRAIQKAAIVKDAGKAWPDVMSMLVCGWTKDEKAKVGRA
jgi:cobaltochelatase CobS